MFRTVNYTDFKKEQGRGKNTFILIFNSQDVLGLHILLNPSCWKIWNVLFIIYKITIYIYKPEGLRKNELCTENKY